MRTKLGLVAVIAVLAGCRVSVVKEDGDGASKRTAPVSSGQALRCAPDDLFASALAVCGDLSYAGSLEVDGDLAVGGDLSHAGTLDVSGEVHSGGAPCGSAGFDVAGAVARAKEDHDDRPAALEGGALVLPGGRYYFEDPSFVGTTSIRVTGHASMFVDGSIDTVGESTIFVEPGASLDLYVAGSVSAVGSLVAAGCDPNALRLYVGGHDAIVAGAGESELRGFLYAPEASVSLAGTTTVTGAIVAKEIDYAGELVVHGRKALPRPAEACGRVVAAPEVSPE